MRRIHALSCLLAGLLAFASIDCAQAAEKRIALVIGESSYSAKPLATAANDAGLVAQTLQAAGFDVTGARDLEGDALRRAFMDFMDKAGASGPETVAFVYFAGYGLQLEGENYLVPTDAAITHDTDIPLRAARLSDYLKPLAALNLKATIVVMDAARENPFTLSGQPIAGGLALYDPPANVLLAYNAAPGTIAQSEPGPYGVYAHALSEMIRAGGMPLTQVFEETRLRVSENTKGAVVPWNSTVNSPFVFFQRTAQAPAREDDSALRSKPIAQLGPTDGYTAAIAQDSLQGYQEYLAAYPGDPSAKRVRAMLAARREAMFWRRVRAMDTPGAYWSYLRRYPHGPHAWDVRRRLEDRAVAMEPPQGFAPVDMGFPPPPPEEIIYVDRPVLYFADPAFGFAPPPPPPVYFLPPPPPEFVVLPPPYVIGAAYVLPVPVFVPVPAYVVAPAYIAPPPPSNVFFANMHNSVLVDRATQNLVISNPQGHVLSSGALTAIGAGAAGLAVGAATLPHFLAKPTAVAPAGLAPANHALPTNLPPPTAGVPGQRGLAPTGQKPLPAGLGAAPAAQPSGLQGKTVAHPPAGGQPAAIGGQAPGLRGSAPPKGVGGGSAPAASHSPHPSAIHAAPPPAPAVVRASPPPTPHAPPVVHAAPPPAPHMPAPAAMHMPSAPAAPAFRAPAAAAMRAPAAPAPHAPHCSMDHGKPVCH
jgi:uncharacterized caspase-like protein